MPGFFLVSMLNNRSTIQFTRNVPVRMAVS
jgi:hypothetical protein